MVKQVEYHKRGTVDIPEHPQFLFNDSDAEDDQMSRTRTKQKPLLSQKISKFIFFHQLIVLVNIDYYWIL